MTPLKCKCYRMEERMKEELRIVEEEMREVMMANGGAVDEELLGYILDGARETLENGGTIEIKGRK